MANARERNRRKALERLEEHKKRGLVDPDIVRLLEFINAYPFFYTTSSCSGRIGLLYVPPSEKKYECVRLGKRHEPVEPDEVREALTSRDPSPGYVILKQEPPILDVAARTLEYAQKLLSAGRAAGFKNSGVKSYNPRRGYEALVELRSTERLDVPVAREDYIVPREYLDRVVALANSKLLRGKQKLRRLAEELSRILGEPRGRARVIF